MTAYLAGFGDGGGLLAAAALLSTILLAVTFAVDRLLTRRVLMRDNMWASVLTLLVLAPLSTLLLPNGVATRLMRYVPLPVGDGVESRSLFDGTAGSSHDVVEKRFERERPTE